MFKERGRPNLARICMLGMSYFAYSGKDYDEEAFTKELEEFNRGANVNISPSQVLYWAIRERRDLLVTQIYEFVIKRMKEELEGDLSDDSRRVKAGEIEVIKMAYDTLLSSEIRRH